MTWTTGQVIITIQVQTHAKGSTLYSTGISDVHYITLYIVNKMNDLTYSDPHRPTGCEKYH